METADYQQYLVELSKGLREFRCVLLAYALMPNHVHLVLRDPEEHLSQFMHAMNTRYTRYFNHRYGRVGHLYQGRFHARLVDRDAYLLEVTRYVHLNPVRARMVSRPEDYPWSSYRHYVRAERLMLELVEPTFVWSLMSQDYSQQSSRYREFVEAMSLQQFPSWERRLRRLKLIGSVRVARQLSEAEVPGTS